MSIENLFIRTRRRIAGVKLDGVIRENHSAPIRIKKNPVEWGVDITDHAIIEPVKISIEGIVSDTPLGFDAGIELLDSIDSLFGAATYQTRSQHAFNSLTFFKNEREPIDVQTGLKLYKNMLITDIKVSQDKDTSKAVFLSIDCEEIIIVQSEVVQIPADQLSAGVTTNQAQSNTKRGRQETTTLADSSATKKSALKTLSGWVSE